MDEFLKEAKKEVQKGVKAKDKTWKDSKWEGFVQGVAWWLYNEKKEDADEVVAAAVGLIVSGATTEEKLQRVGQGDYDKFTEKLLAKGVPDAICEMLYKQYVAPGLLCKKRAGSGAVGGGDIKRPCVEQSGDNDMEVFCRGLSTGNAVVGDNADFIQFEYKLLGMSAYPEVLFVRECYKSMFDKMLEVVENENKQDVVTVMDTPGTGKTVFGLFVMYKLLDEGKTVMYYHGGEDVYFLFGPKGSPVLVAARKHGFEIPEPTETGYVGRITARDSDDNHRVGLRLVRFLEDQPELYYVHDPRKGGINLREAIKCKTIIVSTPHRGKDNTMKNQQKLFYMPVWSRAELALGNVHFKRGLTDKELHERWNKFGGSARWALANRADTTGQERLDTALAKLRHDDMKYLLNPFFLDEDQTSSLVVHIHPTDDFNKYNTRIATPQMFDNIRIKLKLVTNKDVQLWAESIQKSTNISMGVIMEQCWHNQFLFEDGADGCTIRELLDDSVSAASNVPKEKLKFTGSTTFGDNKMSDLHTLEVNEYCLPETPNFETVDSFAALREPFCDLKNKNLCLVGFQMTVGKKKHLKLAGGRKLRLKFKTLFKMKNALPKSNMYIVFVTTKSNEASFTKKVPWLIEKKKGTEETVNNAEVNEVEGSPELVGVRQFVLVIPDTVSAAKRWES